MEAPCLSVRPFFWGCLCPLVLPLAAFFWHQPWIWGLAALALVLGIRLRLQGQGWFFHRVALVIACHPWAYRVVRCGALGLLGALAMAGWQTLLLLAGALPPSAPLPPQAVQVAGVLARDGFPDLHRGRMSLVLKGLEWGDSLGRHYGVQGFGKFRIDLALRPENPGEAGAADEVNKPADRAWLWENLAFQGDVVRLGRQDHSWVILEVEPAEGLWGLRRRTLLAAMAWLMGIDPAGGAAALILGRVDLMEAGLLLAFRQSGCSHLVALSGMHLSLVMNLVMLLCARLLGRRRGQWPAMAALVVFVFLVGPFPSALRALGSSLCIMIARRLGWNLDPAASLVLTMVLVSFLDPFAIHAPGFVLSCAAVMGLVQLQRPLGIFLARFLQPLPAKILSPGLAAQCATAPSALILGFPLVFQGILVSPVLTLCSVGLMACGGLALGLGTLGAVIPGVQGILDQVLELLSRAPAFLTWVLRFFASLAGAGS